MKTQIVLAISFLLPAACLAQHYQVSAPANYNISSPNVAQPTVAQPGFAQPNYAQPTTGPYQPMMAAPTMVPGSAAPQFASGGCDSGSCGVGVGGGCGVDGGFLGNGCGVDGGMIGGCSSGSCGSGGCGLGGKVFGSCGNAGGECCGTYFTIFAGYAELDDQPSTGINRNLLIDFNPGYAVGGAIGRRLGRNLRMELEYTFRHQTPEVVQFNGNFPGNIDGLQTSHAGMMNFVYDLVFGNGRIVPYLGGGIGVASVDSRVSYGSGVATLNGDDTGIAYQWMAGVSLRTRPNMEWFAEYRFFEIDDPKLNRFGGPAIGSVPNPNVLLDSEYISQDIMVGLRFNF